MSQTSQLSRYRPAIVAITGAAAACAIYALYTTYTHETVKTGLQRSNAVRRARGERQPRLSFECRGPSVTAPLGSVVVVGRETRHSFDVGFRQAMIDFESSPELDLQNDPGARHDLDMAVVESILQACYHARTTAHRQMLEDLNGLSAALIDRDIDVVERLAYELLPGLMFDGSSVVIRAAIMKFTNSELFNHPSSSDDDGLTIAETENPEADAADEEPSQGLKGLLYHIAKEDSERKAYEHRGIHCEECGETPIRGLRWHCLNCPDFDLCSTCEPNTEHQKTHVFARIKIPLPVLSQPTKECQIWYPGDPRKMHAPLNSNLKKRLQDEYEFEDTHIDANYDQFTCIANVPWPNDPNGIKAAIDRRAFNKAFTSERWPQRFRPNTLYDRMFKFYDTNKDGLIGFEEFLSGLAYLRGPKRFAPLRRALQGYDIDDDGYLERKDFIRIFRAKHEIQKLLTASMIEGHENEQTQAAMETLRSSQPISSVFSMADIPLGQDRRPTGKSVDAYGDMQPDAGTKTVLNDHEGWPAEATARQPRQRPNFSNLQPQEQLQNHMFRFEQMLDSPTSNTSDGAEGAQYNGTGAYMHQRSRNGNASTPMDNAEGGKQRENLDKKPNEAVNQDILWHIVEQGFHEMLNSLFITPEVKDMAAVKTRTEREKWRREIDQVKREKEEFHSELKSGARVDPLMATALGSSDGAGLAVRMERRGLVSSEIVPTDSATLARREAEIAERPLQELLDASGYSTIDQDAGDGSIDAASEWARMSDRDDKAEPEASTARAMRARYASRVSEAGNIDVKSGVSAHDPTMPQNRPDSVDDTSPPERDILAWYGSLDKRERHIEACGGTGRLSFEEIEEIVDKDPTKDLKGLVTGWLEWASF